MRDETSKNLDSSGGFSVAPPPAGSFIVGPATPAEAGELTALAALCEERPWSSENIASELADRLSFHYLLRTSGEGRLCCFVLARLVIDVLDIYNVGTHPDFRRKGCARFLLNHAIREAKNRGGKMACLEVRATNAAARACYESLGFSIDSVRKEYYDSKVDAILMSRVL
jgi:ribosomal-protein-alanine N-acetyltransferase